jgi:predicted dehydrogenase
VGLGRIASFLESDRLREKPATHAGAVKSNRDTVLVGGMDCDPKRRTKFKKRWNTKVFDDAEAMVKACKPDILIVATHPDSHLQYCTLAASMGVPVVICEKPLADSRRAARKIVALAKRGTKILVNHERRYSSNYHKARSIISNRELGRMLSVKATLCMGRTQRIIDVLWHDGTHLIDAIGFLTNGALRYKRRFGAKLTTQGGTAFLCGDIVSNKPDLPNIPCVIEASTERDALVFEIEVACEGGRVRIGNGIFEVWKSAPATYAEDFLSLVKIREGWTMDTHYFINMLIDASKCLHEPDRQPFSSAKDAMSAIDYLAAAERRFSF